MKIQEGLRKELLKLDSAEKTAEWPKVEKELKDAFYDLEDLIQRVKTNNDEEGLNMAQIDNHMKEYKNSIEQIIGDKNIKEAKNLKEDINGLAIEIRNEVTEGAIDIGRINYHDREFNSLKWKDKIKARKLVNQGIQMINEGKTKALRPLLHEIWDLRIDDEGDKGTLE